MGEKENFTHQFMKKKSLLALRKKHFSCGFVAGTPKK